MYLQQTVNFDDSTTERLAKLHPSNRRAFFHERETLGEPYTFPVLVLQKRAGLCIARGARKTFRTVEPLSALEQHAIWEKLAKNERSHFMESTYSVS